MKFIDDIKDETIIICNDYVKQLLLSFNKLLPIKAMSFAEFMKKYLFSYDEEAILFVMDEYKVKYDIALEYIENTYYILNKHYGNSKLDLLVDIKNKLVSHNLLITNDKFKEYAKRVKIIIYDIYLDNFMMNLFKDLDVKIITREYQDYHHLVYQFDNITDEVYYVANRIAALISEGIDISRIKLTNVDQSYYNTINHIFSLFNLKIDIPYKRPLTSYPLVKEFINKYNETNDINAAILLLGKDDIIYDELINIINKYLIYQNHDLLIYKLEHSYISNPKYDKMIEIIDYLEYIPSDDDYVFMLGFNEGIIPKYYMDTNYITDNMASLLGLNTAIDKNKYLKDRIINVIHDIKNLTITLKYSDNYRNYYESSLCNSFVVTRVDMDNMISYSSLYDKIRLVRAYDNYFKFGVKDNIFDLLNNNYLINYNSYNHKFTGINYQIDKLYLSYSKMNTYNKCNFRYYLDNILKLNVFEENFSAYIGSLIHYVMEKCLSKKDYDVNKYAFEYLNDKELSKKEKFFLDKYLMGLNGLLEQVLKENNYSKFDQAKYEEKIDVKIDDNTHFVGVIDKILYYICDDKTYVALVDYKTGDDDISLDYIDEGINIQLPIYLYLATHLDFKDVIYTGFYLQKFNLLKNDYRLDGYSNSDTDIISIADSNYMNSDVIKGLKIKKDGSFASHSKVLSNTEIDTIIEKTRKVIKKTIKHIRANDFKINPKVIDNVNIGCMYCKYKDICFMSYDDEVIVKKDSLDGGV